MKNAGARRIAERYVRALFDVASAASALGPVEKDLRSLSAALEESEEFRQFLGNPLLTRKMQEDILAKLLTSAKAHKLTRNFLLTLARQKRLEALPEIIEMFGNQAAAARGEMHAELVSAARLKVPEVAQVAERLGKVYNKKVTLDVRQDQALLGGIVVTIGSLRFDASLAGKLARMKLALKAA